MDNRQSRQGKMGGRHRESLFQFPTGRRRGSIKDRVLNNLWITEARDRQSDRRSWEQRVKGNEWENPDEKDLRRR